MAKKSEATGATALGQTGIVQDANQRLWEVDPERDVNGNLIEGEHPDRDEEAIDEREAPTSPDDDLSPIGRPADSDANNAAPRNASKSSDVSEAKPAKDENASVSPRGTSTREKANS